MQLPREKVMFPTYTGTGQLRFSHFLIFIYTEMAVLREEHEWQAEKLSVSVEIKYDVHIRVCDYDSYLCRERGVWLLRFESNTHTF